MTGFDISARGRDARETPRPTSNGASADGHPGVPSALDIFHAAVSNWGDKPALSVGDTTLSYRELNRRANRIARLLVGLGVGPEDRVALVADRSLDLFVALFGAWKSGAAFVPIDPSYPAERLRVTLADAAPVIILSVGDDVLGLPREFADRVIKVAGPARDARISDSSVPMRCVPDSLAYVMYTSGSTGTPKGVMIQHGGVANLVRWLGSGIYRGTGGAHRVGCFNAGFTSDAFIEDLALLLLGAHMYVPDELVRRDPVVLADFIFQHRVELFQCSPTQAHQLHRAGAFGSSTPIRTLIVAGEAMDVDLWQLLAASKQLTAHNVYGPTECTVDASSAVIAGEGPVTIGRPVHNSVIRVLDTDGNLAPIGELGEICIGGAQVARGYLNRPVDTAEKFIPDPYAETPGSRLYRTGDVGSFQSDGSLVFHHRMDDQIKVRGFRVEPGEIEATLRRDPRVDGIGLDYRAGPTGAQRLVAYVVPRAGAIENRRESCDRSPSQAAGGSSWIETADGKPISAEELAEWLDSVTERVLRFNPRSVLDIGCGTGWLVSRVLDHVDRYVGTDFPADRLSRVHSVLSGTHARKGRQFRLIAAAPDMLIPQQGSQLGEVAADGRFDAVVLNAVTRYFPGPEYLYRVLRQAIGLLNDNGKLVLNGLRPLSFVRAFHIWVESRRVARSFPCVGLVDRVRRAVGQECQMAVDARLFANLHTIYPGAEECGWWAEFSLQSGRGDNEFVRFCYNVVVHRSRPDVVVAPNWEPWRTGGTLAELSDRLGSTPASTVALRGIPNSRLNAERALSSAMRSEKSITVGEVLDRAAVPGQHVGAHPQDLYDLAESLDRSVRLLPGQDGGLTMDAVFLPAALRGQSVRIITPGVVGRRSRYANVPVLKTASSELLADLRRQAKAFLPEHMVPNAFVFIERLPINAAGKLDRKSLPDPDGARLDLVQHADRPSTPTEDVIIRLWCELLGVSNIGVEDDFFELGGHSLLVSVLVGRINEIFSVSLSVRDVIEFPRIADLARRVWLKNAASGEVQQAGRTDRGFD